MHLKGEKDHGTIIPLLLTGHTRSILDRRTPGPPNPADTPWFLAEWEMFPIPVFVDIPGDVPGYNGQVWVASDQKLLPCPPDRLDPCHFVLGGGSTKPGLG